MNDLLQARRLLRRYGEHTAVQGLSFTLARGEVLGFLGPNGAGKSTCLQMITGKLAPDSGQVVVHGIDLWQQPEEAKAHIGYLPELPPLYPEQRVDEYLAYCAGLHRVPHGAAAAAVNQAKRRCGLEAVGRKLIGKLSKGYRQRVGIAQAIVHEPDIIVLDEPTVGLDPVQIRESRELIRDLGRNHAVLLSSHLLAEVQSMCTRVLILHQGSLVHEAPIEGQQGPSAHRSLRIALDRPPPPARLREIPGVTAVEPLETGAFRVQAASGDTIPDIARYLVEAGWGLRELTPAGADLEQAFLRSIAGKDAP